jgi:hypothetical protein
VWLLFAVACFALSLCMHALAARLRPRANRVFSYAVVAGLGGLALAIALLASYGPDVRTWAALCLYALSAELYVFLFTMIGSSITARLLILLRRRNMTRVEIDAAFPTSGMVEDRMRNLLQNGLICADDSSSSSSSSSFSLTRRGWRIVRCFRLLRGFFRRTQPS